MNGFVHSIESLGLVDGPGIRSVVFFQGCRLRCLYCHNPDTWELSRNGTEAESGELVKKLLRFRDYYGENGGVTLSGGEPLLQVDFAYEVFKGLKNYNVHTCLDTSGVGDVSDPQYTEKIKKLLSVTDLVLLDVKHTENDGYRKITGRCIDDFNVFLELLKDTDIPVWIRQVIVPQITDSEEYILNLKKYLSNIKNIEKVELLPYHTLGVNKYEKLNIPYPLKNVPPFNKENIRFLENILEKEI